MTGFKAGVLANNANERDRPSGFEARGSAFVGVVLRRVIGGVIPLRMTINHWTYRHKKYIDSRHASVIVFAYRQH
jgi:hypothetical protein